MGKDRRSRIIIIVAPHEQAHGSLTLAAVFMPKQRHPVLQSGTRASDDVRTRQAAYRPLILITIQG